MSNASETPEIPQILRNTPPEEFRELIEVLSGGRCSTRRGRLINPRGDFIG